jgi:AraC-like DNA-binding protein
LIQEQSIRAGAATGVLDAIASAGGRPENALAAAGLVAADLADPDRFIGLQSLVSLYEAAAKESGDDCFGLHLGLGFPLRGLGELSYVVLNAPTVATALRNLHRYLSLHTLGVRVVIEQDGDSVRHSLLVDDPSITPRRQFVEMNAALGFVLLKALIGDDWKPREVFFEHPRPTQIGEHRRAFGAPVRFGSRDSAFVYDAERLQQPVHDADRSLLPIVEKHVRDVLARRAGEAPLVTKLREMVAEGLCDGNPGIQTNARQLAMSSRTLQRRLGECGTSFRDIVDDVRRTLACEYLREGTTSVTEVSFLLGYSELSAFNHAFRRWTEMTPSQYCAAPTNRRDT